MNDNFNGVHLILSRHLKITKCIAIKHC